MKQASFPFISAPSWHNCLSWPQCDFMSSGRRRNWVCQSTAVQWVRYTNNLTVHWKVHRRRITSPPPSPGLFNNRVCTSVTWHLCNHLSHFLLQHHGDSCNYTLSGALPLSRTWMCMIVTTDDIFKAIGVFEEPSQRAAEMVKLYMMRHMSHTWLV